MKEAERYKRACGLLMDALSEYASREFYHAIAFWADRPAGDFAADIGPRVDSSYGRKMPGKLARKTIANVQKKYGDLLIYTRE